MQLSIMILGAGPLQVPAIHEAAALGIRSVALDRNPQAVGLRLCDTPARSGHFESRRSH